MKVHHTVKPCQEAEVQGDLGMFSEGNTEDSKSTLADTEEHRCRLGQVEVQVHSEQARVMLMLVDDYDAGFVLEMQVEMVEEFA